MKQKWVEILINILFWAATVWFIISGFSIESQEIELINGEETIQIIRNETLILKLILCIGVSAIIFYTNLWILTRTPYSATILKKASFSALCFILGSGFFFLTETINLTGFELPLPFPLALGVMGFYFTVSCTYGLGKVWIQSEKRQQQLLLDKKQAELTLLRNQLQPHFLFNALNNLLSMVDQKESPKLAAAFDQLSQLLRYIVDEVQGEKVPLQKEIHFLRNYTALQLLRFEPGEIKFEFNINGSYDQQPVEPGIFLPFVENAFKYGTSPETESKIELNFDLSVPHEIGFTVRNKIVINQQRESGHGKGIAGTRDRLNLVYPGKHQLTISKNDFFFLKLKLITK